MKTVIIHKRPPNLRKATTKVSLRRARCIICSTKLKDKQTKFCSKKCKCRGQSNVVYRNQQIRGSNRKKQLVDHFGGKCQKCNYNKSRRALCFHHINPKLKGFSLDLRHLSNRSWDQIMKEAQKCILLCANCHMELHDTIETAALTN